MRSKLQIGSLQADSAGTGSAAATDQARPVDADRHAFRVTIVRVAGS